MDLALNNLHWLMCHKTKPNQTKPGGVVANVLDCDTIVREFEPKSHFYDIFRTNTLGNGMNRLILTAIG